MKNSKVVMIGVVLLACITALLGFTNKAQRPTAHADVKFSTTALHTFGAGEVASTPLGQGTLFASANGNGSTCSENSPCTIQTAITQLNAGDVLFLRGGEYIVPDGLDVTASGTASNPIIIESYPGEWAVLTGAETVAHIKANPFQGKNGIRLRNEYISVRKLEIKQMALVGVRITGSHNRVEGCVIHHNFLGGINIYGGEWHCTPDCPPYVKGYNVVSNNTLYANSDAELGPEDGYYDSGDNADGVSVSSGKFNDINHNTVYGNSDDGIDVWRSNDSTVTFNRVYDHGRGAKGNGNGIKAGGNLDANATNGLRAIVEHNIVYDNRTRGIDYNAGKQVVFRYNTSYNNGTRGFSSADDSVVQHNIAANNGQSTLIKAGHTHNSWQETDTVIFISTDPNSDDFLRPEAGSVFETMGAYAPITMMSVVYLPITLKN